MKTVENLYLKLPKILRNIAIETVGKSISKRRYSNLFFNILDDIETHVSFTDSEMYNYVLDRLRETLKFQYKYSKYYSKLITDYGLHLNQMDFSDFRKLPVQTKADIKNHYKEIAVNSLNEKAYKTHTSGTTGSGLVFPITRRADSYKWAVWWRFRRLHGIEVSTWCSYFGGRTVVPKSYSGRNYWQISHALNQVMYSMYHLSPKTVTYYVDDLNRRKLSWIHGYPSTIAFLAFLIQSKKLKLDYAPKWITLGAENVQDSQIAIIKEVFGIKPIQHYGLTEPVANISEYPNNEFIVDEDYAYHEFIPVEGQSGFYRIIGTSLYNNAFQFLRYDTGDIVKLDSPSDAVFDGKKRKINSIDGRSEDYIVLPDGTKIGRLDHIFKDIEDIAESQLFQKKDGRVLIKIVPTDSYKDTITKKRIQKEWETRIGKVLPIEIITVNEILRGSNGKLRFVVSEYNNNEHI